MPLDLAKIHKLSMATFVNGKWKKPAMSRKDINSVKKLALIAGVKWTDPPHMVTKPKPMEFVIQKGIAYDKRVEQRIQKSKELMQGQIKKWAEQNKQRRDKLKDSKKERYVDYNDFLFPHYSEPQISKWDTVAIEEYQNKKAKTEAREKYWAGLAKGAGPAKKLSGEERLAKKRAEREAKKKEKAAEREVKEAKKKQEQDARIAKQIKEGSAKPETASAKQSEQEATPRKEGAEASEPKQENKGPTKGEQKGESKRPGKDEE